MKNKKMTGYASIDEPQNINSTFFERYPIIPNTNVFTVLKLLSRKYLNDISIDCKDLRVNYKQLLNDAVTISLAMKELGVKKGEIVSISMPNFYQALAAFLACNRIGVIATFLDPFTSAEEISSYLNIFESPILINYNKDDIYNNNIKKITKVKHIITLNSKNLNSLDLNNDYRITSNDNQIDFNSLETISKFQKRKLERLHFKNEDALILFTSGTTGNPKSVLLTNENILAAEIYAKNTSHTENIKASKTLVCVPFMYPYGLITSALTSLLWGKEAILAPDISMNTINYYYSKKPNIIFGSPALLDLTMKNIPDNQDLSFVSHFISGGDFLTESHAERGNNFFKSHGASDIEIGNGFGNAETVSICSTPVGVPLRQETAGKILVGSKVMILDPDTGEEKKYGEEGLLYVSGKHVFKEYFKNSELTHESKIIRNGITYYNTGTLGIIDESGYFVVTGRQSRFYIVSSLNKVYCDKIQNIISTFDCVKDCAVVAVPDEEKLYVNKVYIVLNDNVLNSDDVIENIKALFYKPTKSKSQKTMQLKEYEIPSFIEIVSELPRKTGTDKINYELLQQDAIAKLETNKKLVLK